MKNVLIVDDEERLLLSMKAGLDAYKNLFRVVTALNGKEALDILNRTEIHLVVTDLKMPEMDGFELLVHLNTHFPFIPSIVMTAFNTPEIEERLKYSSTLQVLEKPVEFDVLAEAIKQTLNWDIKGGTLTGISLPNFLQLITMEQKTCLLEVRNEREIMGLIYFYQGELFAAASGDIKGEEAVYRMLALEDVRLRFKSLPKKKIRKLIQTPLMSVLMEGMRRKDAQAAGSAVDAGHETLPAAQAQEESRLLEDNNNEDQTAEISLMEEADGLDLQETTEDRKGAMDMKAIQDALEKLKEVDGFMAVGVFSPNGEMAAQVNSTGVKIEELGALANEVLLKAQKATEMMQVGRGQIVHVEAPKAHVIARCLNEATDFSTTAAGRAHVHMVLILAKECNLAMAKMKLGSVIQEVAPAFR